MKTKHKAILFTFLFIMLFSVLGYLLYKIPNIVLPILIIAAFIMFVRSLYEIIHSIIE
jgi:hypothetical protein